jgi:MFS family permease
LTDSEAITIFLGIVLVITSIFGAILMDKFGNKRLLIVGLIGTAVFNVIASVGSLFGSTMIVTIGFSLTKSCIGLGAGAPSWFLTSELVSANVTSICQAISTGLLLMSVGLITSIYLPLDSHLNELSTLVVLSFPATFCAIFMFLFLPETKNRRLERIRSHLGTHFFTGFVQFPKDDQSRRSTSTYLKKDRLHSYGSMGTLRLPSLSQNSSGNDSLRFHNKYVF